MSLSRYDTESTDTDNERDTCDASDTCDGCDGCDTCDACDSCDTCDINSEINNQEDMTAYKCIRKIMEAGGSYELLVDGNIKLRVPSTAAHLIPYANAHYDDIKAALRVQLWQQHISDTDLFAGWKRAMAAGMMDVIKVRVYPDRDYLEIDYIQLAEHEEISKTFCPEDFE